MKCRKLKNQKKEDDRQQCNEYFLGIMGQGLREQAEDVPRVFHRSRGGRGGRTALCIEKHAEDQNREHRPDRTERDQAKAVVMGTGVAAHSCHTEPQCEDERHSDRPGGDAARIERDCQEIGRSKRGDREDGEIKPDQHQREAHLKEDAQECEHQKHADAKRDRQNQGHVWDRRHLLGKHLEVRLGNRDHHAHNKSDADQKGQPPAFGELCANPLPHRQVSPQREKPHAKNQQGSSHRKEDECPERERRDRQVQDQYNHADRQHRGDRLLDFEP